MYLYLTRPIHQRLTHFSLTSLSDQLTHVLYTNTLDIDDLQSTLLRHLYYHSRNSRTRNQNRSNTMFSFIAKAATLALAVSPAFGKIYTTNPVATTTGTGGQVLTVQWGRFLYVD